MKKATGLAAFKRKIEDNLSVKVDVGQRQRGKKDTVSLTVRVTRSQWERLHHLAIAEGVSLQNLCLKGLRSVFKERGLPEFR